MKYFSIGLIVSCFLGLVTFGLVSSDSTSNVDIMWEDGPDIVSNDPPDTIPSFPEARGWGATSLHDARSLPVVVHQVLNTDDDHDSVPSDSFREAILACDPNNYDIIIFRTGGLIVPEENIEVPSNCENMYIAGQTAPGGGIKVTRRGIVVPETTSDIVIRNITIKKTGPAAFTFRPQKGVMDHMSIAWGGTQDGGGHNNITSGFRVSDETAPGSTSGIYTASNILSSEPIGMEPREQSNDNNPRNTNWNPSGICSTLHSNFIVGPAWRMPLMSTVPPGCVFAFVNNVVYNWRDHNVNVTHDMQADIIGNYLKAGPASRSEDPPIRWRTRCAYDPFSCVSSMYVAGNVSDSTNFQLPESFVELQWEGGIWCNETTTVQWDPGCENNETPPAVYSRSESFESDSENDGAYWPYEPVPHTDELRDAILDKVGSIYGLSCNGEFFTRRSDYDQEKIDEFYAGTGESQYIVYDTYNPQGTSEHGGTAGRPHPDDVPVVNAPDAGTACTDSSGDGIPDDWYTANGYDPNDPPNVNQTTDSDYLLIEHYLNGSDPEDATPWDVNGISNGVAAFTFEDTSRRVYLVDLVSRGHGVGPDPNVVPIPTPGGFIAIRPQSENEVLVCTPADLGTPLTISDVDTRMATWWPNSSVLRSDYLKDLC